jgi:iron complex outermembrane receptor protein
MTAKKLFLFLGLLVCGAMFAQRTIVALREVTVSDVSLRKFSASQSVAILNDSVIAKNAASLTALLSYNSLIYFKENGLGNGFLASFQRNDRPTDRRNLERAQHQFATQRPNRFQYGYDC